MSCNSRSLPLLGALLLCVASSACDKTPPSAPETSSERDDPTTPREPIVWISAHPGGANPNDDYAIRQVVKHCKLDEGKPVQCEEVAERTRAELLGDPFEGLIALTIAASDEHAPTRAYASWFIHEELPEALVDSLVEEPGQLSEDLIDRLEEVTLRSEPLISRRTAAFATHAAAAHRRIEPWLARVDELSDLETRAAAYEASMRVGRLEPLERLEEISKNPKEDEQLRAAALRAPLAMLPWRAEDEAERVCEWMLTRLSERAAKLEALPFELLKRCRADEVQPMLTELRARVDEGAFSPALSEALSGFCSPEQPLVATAIQCDEYHDLLEHALTREALPIEGRIGALNLLMESRPDERTRDVVGRLSKLDTTPAKLREVATRSLDEMEAARRR